MASLSGLSGEVWLHTQLDRAVSNAEKNKRIPAGKQAEPRSKSSRSVRFKDGGASPHESTSQSYPASKLLQSKGKSNQVLAFTKRYRESLHSMSESKPVAEFENGEIDTIAGLIHVEWTRLCQTMTKKPDPALAEMSGDVVQLMGQFLSFRQ